MEYDWSRSNEDGGGELSSVGWGSVPLFWVVTKTYQHTNEHTSDVLRMALNWDYYAAQEQAGGTGAA